MRKFFAALRRFLAVDHIEQMFTAIAQEAIQSDILPELREMADRETSEEKRQAIQSNMAMFERYANPNGSEGRLFGQTGASVIYGIVKQFGLGHSDADDVAQDIAAYFYNPKIQRETNLRKFLSHNPNGTPIEFNRFFGHIVKRHALWRSREIGKTLRPERQPRRDDEDQRDEMENVPAPTQEMGEREFYEHFYEEMREHIYANFNKPWEREMFDMWLKMIPEGRPNMKTDIYPTIEEKYGKKPSTQFTVWIEMQRAIAKFFEEQTGKRLPSAIKRKLHLSSADFVAYGEFRRRLSVWLLPKQCRLS